MAVLWMNLVFTYVFAFLARISTKFSHTISESEYKKPNILLVVFVATAFILVSGLRKGIGDTFGYMLTYSMADFNWEYVMSRSKEQGFTILQLFLHQISGDPQILVFTTGLITNVLVVAVLYKYSRLFDLSIYTYITSGLFLVSMNGVRQFLAGAILFAATKYLLNGRWLKYTLLVLLASTFHESALIYIPLYFFVRRQAWSKSTFFLISCAIVFVIGYNQLSGVMFSLMGDHYSQYKDFNEGGANVIRVAVYAVPLLFCFLGRAKMKEIFPQSDVFVNMALIGLIFMIISTQNWIYARYIIYFGLYNLILISWVVKLFVKKQQKLVYYIIIIFYFIYYFYENVITLNIKYPSDYLNF